MSGPSDLSSPNGMNLIRSSYFSCRKRDSRWIVAMNRWQDLTDMEVNEGMLILYSLVFSD